MRLLLLTMFLTLPSVAHASRPHDSTPAVAPAFSLPTRTGAVVLDSLRGRVVLVDFWASWCEPCRKSFPWLATMQARYASRGLTVVAVNVDKSRQASDAFLAEFPSPFTVAFDPAGKTAEAFHVRGMPSSVLIGRDGRVLHAGIGFDPKQSAAFEATIAQACAP